MRLVVQEGYKYLESISYLGCPLANIGRHHKNLGYMRKGHMLRLDGVPTKRGITLSLNCFTPVRGSHTRRLHSVEPDTIMVAVSFTASEYTWWLHETNRASTRFPSPQELHSNYHPNLTDIATSWQRRFC